MAGNESGKDGEPNARMAEQREKEFERLRKGNLSRIVIFSTFFRVHPPALKGGNCNCCYRVKILVNRRVLLISR